MFVTPKSRKGGSKNDCFVLTARVYARAVLGVVILSVRPSVCLSVSALIAKKTK